MRKIVIRSDEVTLPQEMTHVPREITLQQGEENQETGFSAVALKYIRLEQIKHEPYWRGNTNYVYGGQLSNSREGANILAYMMTIAESDLEPLTSQLNAVNYRGVRKMEIRIANQDMVPRPLPKRQYDILMSVFAHSEYWYDLALEHKRKLMDDPTVNLEWKQNARQRYLAETRETRLEKPKTKNKLTSFFLRR